ncbi:MAG: threonine synthase [Alphaproteobacteria bacterium]|nr:threonine synthase [Alphaproteobacteria bacterium]
MQYVSTRGVAPVLDFTDVLLAGLARDGGLYVPASWPRLSYEEIAALAGRSYVDVATTVIAPFVAGALSPADLRRHLTAAYAGFSHRAIAPLRQLGDDEWLLELFHGPTQSFKDYALQLLGRLFDDVLARRGQSVTIVGATSGDTGSAAIEACRDRPSMDVFILFPNGRVSEIQRRQMTTVESANIHCIAVEGTFDDCQALVKAMFDDHAFRDRHRLAAVNSINWGRIMAQVVYYFTAALALGAPARPVMFSVPTGNFGDVFAGYVAAQMGLPVAGLVVATNINDILARFFASGRYQPRGVVATTSPSMDIQVSSNFERLLFDLTGRDGRVVSGLMADLKSAGAFKVGDNVLAAASPLFTAARIEEAEAAATIAAEGRHGGVLLDPHSAIAVAAARKVKRTRGVPIVSLATAHAAKFPDAVARASGVRPTLPANMEGLLTRPERVTVLPNDLDAVRRFVTGRARVSQPQRVPA